MAFHYMGHDGDIYDCSARTVRDTIPLGLKELMIESPQEAHDKGSSFHDHLSMWLRRILENHERYPKLDWSSVLRGSDDVAL